MPFIRIPRLFGFLCLFLLPLTLWAGDPGPKPPRVFIDAALSDDGDALVGRITFEVINRTAGPIHRIPLWLYPNRFAEPGPLIGEGVVRWIYPKGKSRGAMAMEAVQWNGVSLSSRRITYAPTYFNEVAANERILANILLPQALAPNERGRLTVDFHVEIPVRRGRFGRHRGVVSLGGGWFPRPLTDLTGVATELPPDLIEADLHLRLPPGRGAVVGEQIFPLRQTAQTVWVKGLLSEDVAVVVMDRMEVTERRFDWGVARHVHQSLSWKKPTWRQTVTDDRGLPEVFPEPGRFDYSERLLDVVGHTAALIREVAPKCPLKKELVLVDIPAWDHLVQIGPGPVLVSDRLWRLLPAKDALFFHDLALVRAVATTLISEGALRLEMPTYRFVAADMAAAFFADHYSRTIHDKRRSIKEILGIASIFPIVDDLIYAPKIPFKEVYDRSVEEPDPLRDEPWRFMSRQPRGKRLFGKLRDLVGEEAIRLTVRRFVEGEMSFEAAVTSALGGDAAWFFDQWYGDYPKVNYRLGAIEDTVLGGGQIRHDVEVIREGAVIREPVTVRMTDEQKRSADLVWDSDAERRHLSWTSSAPIEQVEIDPDYRLVEEASLTPDHPLADNIRPLPWRPPMFTRIVFWGELTGGEPYVELGFWLRRRYDVTNVISLDGDYSSYSYGGTLMYYRYFGTKRTLNARSWYLGPEIAANRYHRADSRSLPVPDAMREAATMGSVGFFIGRDNRTYGWDPLTGTSFSLAAIYTAGVADDNRMRQVGRVSGLAGTILSAGLRHTFAIYGGLSGVFGDPVAANLTTLTNRIKLRGFDVAETYGRFGINAVVEYRHTIMDAANLKAPLYSWFDRFQGVLFVAGGTVSEISGYEGLFRKDRLFSEVGYGLRIHLLAFGVAQYIIALDFACPITPLDRHATVLQTDGTEVSVRRSPFKLVFGITQTF